MVKLRPGKSSPQDYIKGKKRDAARVTDAANRSVDRLLIERLHNLADSWRFILSWLALSVLLVWVLAIQVRSLAVYHTQIVARDGGTYVEGMLGPLTNMNPMFATSSADLAVSKLLFSGLMRYDINNNLVNDLADSVVSDEKASSFTVNLKQGLRWHDGQVLTAHDVAYTIEMIQHPDTRSPQSRSWEGVKVEVVSDTTVLFTLPGSYSPFPQLLTFGVLPRHILQNFEPSQLRGIEFNSSAPVGSGPFRFQRIINEAGSGSDDRELKVQLTAYEDYHLGQPRIDAITLWVTPDKAKLTELFKGGELDGAAEIDTTDLDITELGASERIFSLTSGVFLFFKTTNPVLSDVALRQALTKAINVPKVIGIDNPQQRLYGPLLPELLGYTTEFRQSDYDPLASDLELNNLGWLRGPDGIRVKDGVRLSFAITTQDETEYSSVVEKIVEMLYDMGVEATIDLRDPASFADTVLQDHDYQDMLVYGINIGSDPDVYPFWHSSQADTNSTIRLNLSEYSSEAADEALEGGHSRTEAEVRVAKYRSFLQTWAADAPAVGLYRTTYVYYELKNIGGPKGTILQNKTDRFRDVHKWTVLTERIPYDDL